MAGNEQKKPIWARTIERARAALAWVNARLNGAILLGLGAILLVTGFAITAYALRSVWQAPLVRLIKYESFAQSGERLTSLAPGTVFQDCAPASSDCPIMVLIAAGVANIGDAPANAGSRDEAPRRQVTLEAFAVSQTEITFDHWQACVNAGGCPNNPTPEDEDFGRGSRPVIHVSWVDAKEYVEWLSRMTGRNYRLLSEDEWEYAARAQSDPSAPTTRYAWGDVAGEPEYLVSEIFLRARTDAEFAAQLQVGSALLDQMRSGVPFPRVARNVSNAQSAPFGGDTGWRRLETLPEETRLGLSRLTNGQVTLPLRTRDGVYILAVRDKRETTGNPVCDANAPNGAAFILCSERTTWPVASFHANAFGLHDMHGNIWEWVEDCYGRTPSPTESTSEPSIETAPSDVACTARAIRGGAWDETAFALRSANRAAANPRTRAANTGFRVARTL